MKENGTVDLKMIVFKWSIFLQAWLQKQLSNLASVKVWGIIISSVALFWGAITGLVFGDWHNPKEFLEVITRPGLISGGEFVSILGIIYGVRETFKVVDLYFKRKDERNSKT